MSTYIRIMYVCNKVLFILGIFSVLLICAGANMKRTSQRKQYAMYVWDTGFDRSVSSCDVNKFLEWNSKGACFTHVWNTHAKRQWLWNTCNLAGREVEVIYLSGVHHNLKLAYDTRDFSTSDVSMVKQTLEEGHTQVPNLKIYGLYAVSDIDVSEKDLIKYIVHYNDVCAAGPLQRFDGIATNNEAYADIKCGSMSERVRYLDNLKQIVVEAAKQMHGKLFTHYSVSWHWGLCNGQPSVMTWNGKSSDVNHHMIDIFDSVDVQVGYIIFPAISDRMVTAGYDYALSHGKSIYTTFYTSKDSTCQITFFPNDTCRVPGHSESNMFRVMDSFAVNGIGNAKPCIHYFRGVYSSGGHSDWPVHELVSPPVVG